MKAQLITSNQMTQEILLRFQELLQSGKPKAMDSNAMCQAIEANLVTLRASGELSISQSNVIHHLHNWAAKFCLTLPKYCKTFDSPK